MIKVGIIGATGYTGQELVRILAAHDQARLEVVTSRSYAGQDYSDVFPSLRGAVDLVLSGEENLIEIAERVDVLFLALPHGLAAQKVAQQVLDRARVIDLGSDFRLESEDDYRTWYQMSHPSAALLAQSVYGLPECNGEKIKSARLVANPGCYATCSILSILPMASRGLIQAQPVIIDAKSGVSGAGRSLALGTHFNEANESIKAYKIFEHRHTPEIEQQLSAFGKSPVSVVFTPHLIPMQRGILTTVYADLPKQIKTNDLYEIYREQYEKDPFVKILSPDQFPETRWVKGSNFCHLGVKVDDRTGKAIVVGAIDNLVKGAAGQAVQNMNLIFGLAETTGLAQLPLFP